MNIMRVSRNDTGASHRVQIDAGRDGSLVVLSNEGGAFVSRVDEAGNEALLASTTELSQFRYGYVETLSDGRYALYTTWHFGQGTGARVQILNTDGSPATEVINPMFEAGEDRNGAGYTLTPTQNGGFAFVWNDISRYSESFEGTQPPYNGHTALNSNAGYDVRVRFFDDDAVATGPSVVADDDVETLNGATISRRARDQYINDSETLAGGATAFTYIDQRWAGSSGGGAQPEWTLSLQIAQPGNVGEPVKIDLGPIGNQFGEYPESLTPSAGANIVTLPDGTFAVIWTENTYVAANVWGGWQYSGTQTLIRYFSASGDALTDPIAIVTRDTAHGNHSTYVWGEALPDGRIAIAYNVGVYGVNGNGTLDAFVGVVGPLGSSIDVSQVNATAQNSQFYTIEDFAVRNDGTLELAYHDASQLHSTVIERFAVTGAGEAARVGTVAGEAISGDGAANAMFGLGGNDQLYGESGDDRIHGQEGNDLLVGGVGADGLFGGAGNDVYRIDDALDTIFEALAGGDDRVSATVSYTLNAGAYVETIGTANANGLAAINLTGNELGQSITGNAAANILKGMAGVDLLVGLGGNDVLDGGSSADNLRGGTGNDNYRVDNIGDRVIENVGEGDDTVLASGSFILDTASEVEALRVLDPTTTSALNMTGNDFGQSISGNAGANILKGLGGNDLLVGDAGNDVLDGGTGADNMRGGTGNDNYRIDSASDRLFENAGEGDDIAIASLSYALAAGVEVEGLVSSDSAGTTAQNLTGNEFGQSVTGNAGVNSLSGGGGIDSLNGFEGNDTVNGGTGNDVLRGGTGQDGFRFDTALVSNVDRIIDFSVADDTILLENAIFTGLAAGALPGSAFHTGGAAADASDRIIYDPATGALMFDSDGLGGAAAVQFATLGTGLALTASDFTVI